MSDTTQRGTAGSPAGSPGCFAWVGWILIAFGAFNAIPLLLLTALSRAWDSTPPTIYLVAILGVLAMLAGAAVLSLRRALAGRG